MNRIRAGAAIGATALLIVLAGCSTPAPSTDGSDSPLGKYLSSIWGGDLSEDEQMERFAKENVEREELTAQCMTEQGFEYLPVTQTGSMMFSSGDEWKPDDAEWVAQYGYGMVNFPGKDAAPSEEEQPYVDPNEDYVASLTESERTAYYEALHGPAVPEEELDEDGSYEWDWETAGCYGFAQHEMEGDNPALSEEHKPVMDAINEFYASLETSTDFAEIDAAWAACMADAGHAGFARQQDASASISEELNEYYENQTEWVEDDPALDGLAEKEIALALVDLECREEVDYRATQQEASFALEEQFIADHKAELDALKAAAEQGS